MTRVTDTLERMMAQAVNNPAPLTVADRRRWRRDRAAVRERHDVRREHRGDRITPEPD